MKEVIKVLSFYRVTDFNVKDIWGNTPLHYAAKYGHLEIMELLLQKGAHIDPTNYWCEATPLHYAASTGQVGEVKFLLDSSADPTLRDDKENTPAHWAALKGHTQSVILQNILKCILQPQLAT